MPKTLEFLRQNQFFTLRGYNRMGESTYPNLMAAFAGRTVEDSERVGCNPTKTGGLEKCPFVWKNFERAGYATAYTEDFQQFSTFNYQKRGFIRPPVDYYGRGGTLLLEDKLKNVSEVRSGYCPGNGLVVKYVHQHALDFAELYKKDPFFGIFWTNALTHDRAWEMLSMEEQLLGTLQQTKSRGILNESIVIVMADHGPRKTALNFTSSWHEKNWPIFHISLPNWFKDQNPEAVTALTSNQDRLTSHYDLFLTFQDILQRTGRVASDNRGRKRSSCRDCQSLLRLIPFNRTCAQAGIPEEFCTCDERKDVPIDQLTRRAGMYLVWKINQIMSEKKDGLAVWKKLKLKKVLKATEISYKTLQLDIETEPGSAHYRGIVKYNGRKGSKMFSLEGKITGEDENI